jgi:hypothetical protein
MEPGKQISLEGTNQGIGEGFEKKQTRGDAVTELFGRLKLTPSVLKYLSLSFFEKPL